MKRLIAVLIFALIGFLYPSNSLAIEKLVVLTFDDGPRPDVLLGKNGQIGLMKLLESSFGKFIPTHFFVIGGEAQVHPKLIETLSQKGFFVENHTYGHDNLLKLKARNNYGNSDILKNIQETDSLIFKITGRHPKYLRPPYWAIDTELNEYINSAIFGYGRHYKVVSLEKPDINTMDYDDHSKKRPPTALIERVKKIIESRENRGEYRHVLVFHELPITVESLKTIIPYLISRGYSFGTLDDFFSREKRHAGYGIMLASLAVESPSRAAAKAVYLSVDHLYNPSKVGYIFSLFDGTELNAVIIDFKVDKLQVNQYVKDIVERFHQKGIYVIGRLVMFQDSYLAKNRPHLAIRNKNGDMCFSGKKIWQRYWVDMASDEVINYNIEIAKQGIDMGFDEINFDYIRFPSDLKNCNLKNDIIYPVWDGKDKYQTMRQVFSTIKQQLKDYAAKNNTNIVLSIDIFGEVFAYGSEPGIGQKLSDIAEFFDVISPMAYPSHYQCGEFGLKDPNTNPYIVYKRTLEPGLRYLRSIGFNGEVRPWIQDFSIPNIYSCGPVVFYGPKEVKAQIQASEDLGVTGFMLWNAANNYTKKALMR